MEGRTEQSHYRTNYPIHLFHLGNESYEEKEEEEVEVESVFSSL